MSQVGKNVGKVKDFLKPTEKKIAIGVLTAVTLAVLALWNKIGYRVFTEIINGWDWGLETKVCVIIDYNPLVYPMSHLFGHVKDEFEMNLLSYLYGLGSPTRDYVINQFIRNIPYYVGVGYAVGCSVVEGTKGVGSSFLYAVDKVLGKVESLAVRANLMP